MHKCTSRPIIGITQRRTYTDELAPPAHSTRVLIGHKPGSPQDRPAVDKSHGQCQLKTKKKQPNTTCMYYITMNIRV